MGDLLYQHKGRPVSVCRVKEGFHVAKLQDWLEPLGSTTIDGRSWSKLDVRIVDHFIVVTNTVRAKGCLRRTHNENLMFNIEKILEDNYLKEKQDATNAELSDRGKITRFM